MRVVISVLLTGWLGGLIWAGEVDELDQLLDDDEDIGEFGGGRLAEMLRSMEFGRPYQRRSAIWKARRHPESSRLEQKLIEILEKGEPQYASISAVALGVMKSKRAVPALCKALSQSSSWLRESSAYALGLIGDRSAVQALKKSLPTAPGVSRWIFEDALLRLETGNGAPSPHSHSLKGAGVFWIGWAGTNARDFLRRLIKKYDLRIYGSSPPPLNVVLRKYGGHPDLTEFYKLLEDRNGKPQLEVVIVQGLLPYEFPAEARWKLFNFVRRGGSLIMLGNAMFARGVIKTSTVRRRTVHTYAFPEQLLHACLPEELNNSFRPYLAGIVGEFRGTLRSGTRTFGYGRTIVLATDPRKRESLPLLALGEKEAELPDYKLKGWGHALITDRHIENMLLYALQGDSPFHTLIDLYDTPGELTAGDRATFKLNLFSVDAKDGELLATIRKGKETFVTKRLSADLKGRKLLPLAVTLELPWTLRDGEYETEFTFRNSAGVSRMIWSLSVKSPIRLFWQIKDSYDEPGGVLEGSAEVMNQRQEAIPNVELVLRVLDVQGRALQRYIRKVSLKPGKNGPFPLRLYARDYRIGSYYLVLELKKDGEVIQTSERHLHRCGPYRFQQDLVYVPWNSSALPDDERMRKLLVESGFNCVWSLKCFPGWYNWGVDGPRVRCMPVWLGELVEKVRTAHDRTMKELADYLRHCLPGYTIMDPWDESPVELVVTDRGDDLGVQASILYRNWLKSKYLTLEALNRVWRKEYEVLRRAPKGTWLRWTMPSGTRIPPPRPWQGDLTSWNQIWAWRGAPRDWRYYAENLWADIIFSEAHALFRKHDPNHWWHWSDAFHTRLYIGQRPAQLSLEAHQSRARFGNRPSTIMLHFYYVYQDKRPEVVRSCHWDGLAGGGRHFIVWAPTTQAVDGLFPDTSIWNADYTLRSHGVALADSIRRVRSKEQVLLASRNSLSREVAFLYVGTSEFPFGAATPKALFYALLFGGIMPESLKPGTLRSDRMPLDSFKVIFVCRGNELQRPEKSSSPVEPLTGDFISKLPLSEDWQRRLETWQKKGGVVLDASSFGFRFDGDRIESPGFTSFQRRIFALLEERGVRPPIEVVDDNELPEPSVLPVLLETEDRSQFYLLLVPDWDIRNSQAFGDLDKYEFREKIELRGDFIRGVTFTVNAHSTYYPWFEIDAKEPFRARVTVDDKPSLPLVVYRQDTSSILLERGLGRRRWVAGPPFRLENGEHILKLEPIEGKAVVRRVRIVREPVLQPTILCRIPGVKEIYDVFNDKMLSRNANGWRATLRASYGEVYSLITEEIGAMELEPRLQDGETDRRVQLKITIRRSDGSLSRCRHSLNIRVLDKEGNEIRGLSSKTSVRGWRVVTLFPAYDDPPLPWVVEVKDLTSGRSARAPLRGTSNEPFRLLEPLKPVVLRVLQTPPLEADIHIVPLRVKLINNRDRPLRALLHSEIPREHLLSDTELSVEVPPHSEKTVGWDVVLGRKQAIQLRDKPPRVWLTSQGGIKLEAVFDDVWAPRWEKTPPLVTNLRPSKVSIRIANLLEREIEGRLQAGIPEEWEILKPLPASLRVPGGQGIDVSYEARVKPFTEQSPEVKRVPLAFLLDGKHFDCGFDLVETEKHREWYVAESPLELGGLIEKFEPEMPSKPLDARKRELWNLEWKRFESDTMIDFPCEVGHKVFAVSNVAFARSVRLSCQARGEKVQVWLGGVRLILRGEEQSEEPAELIGERTVRVQPGVPVPIVVRYHRVSPFPLTDLAFLDESGKVIWSSEFRADPSEFELYAQPSPEE